VKITLDNGEVIRCTPDHHFPLRKGGEARAEDLTPGDSMMPFRRYKTNICRIDGLKGKLNGYEKVYDPSDRIWKWCHRVVGEQLLEAKPGQVVHHKNFDRTNNDPTNLRIMSPSDHQALHREAGRTGGRAVAELRKHDADLDRRLREGASKAAGNYVWTQERRDSVSECNRRRGSRQHIIDYNNSPQHKIDNAIRSEGMKALWRDPERKARTSRNMRIKFPPSFVEGVRDLVRENPDANMDVIGSMAMDVLREELQSVNNRKIVSIHRHMLTEMVRSEGYSGFEEFRKAASDDNHKVVSVERLTEREDTYTLTVDGTHTFALEAGIYTFNSPHEDFYIPTRGGKDSTRVDVISGPDVQMIDDVDYLQDKLDRFLKIPKDSDGESDRTLASRDAKFARACMRIQREFILGVRKIARVHMAALNIDPDSVEWQIKMTVPSAIFEMQQIELMNAQAALASSMSDWASKPWILEHIFHMSSDDAAYASQEKNEEDDAQAKREANTQADIMRMYPELQEAPPAEEGVSSANGATLSEEIIGLKKIIEETGQTFPEMIKRFEGFESRMASLEEAVKTKAL
jgi:hypothetical protein